MDHTERVTSGPERQYYEAAAKVFAEAAAKMEKYETAMHEAIELFKHSTHTCDRDRAIAVLEKALQGTRYDRSSAV